MISMFSMGNSPSVVGINFSGMFLVISNGNGNMPPISENYINRYVLFIGNALHAYISNGMQILNCLYVDT